MTVIESLAVLVAAGAATAEDIANNGGDIANIWSILVNFGSIIPKIIFGSFGERDLGSNRRRHRSGRRSIPRLTDADPADR